MQNFVINLQRYLLKLLIVKNVMCRVPLILVVWWVEKGGMVTPHV